MAKEACILSSILHAGSLRRGFFRLGSDRSWSSRFVAHGSVGFAPLPLTAACLLQDSALLVHLLGSLLHTTVYPLDLARELAHENAWVRSRSILVADLLDLCRILLGVFVLSGHSRLGKDRQVNRFCGMLS